MVTRNKFWTVAAVGSLLFSMQASAAEIERNTAQMQAMDKITGRVSVIDVPVNSEVAFGSFSIVVRACKTTPPEETPENYAFVDVADSSFGKMQFNIFKGWMMSSSPALNAVEHPIYDVWLLKCIDTNVDKSKLLSEEQLKERDALPKLSDIKQETGKADETPAQPSAEAETQQGQNPVVEEKSEEKVLEDFTQLAELKEQAPESATLPLAAGNEEIEGVAATEKQDGPQSLLNIEPPAAPEIPQTPEPAVEESWVELPPAGEKQKQPQAAAEAPAPLIMQETATVESEIPAAAGSAEVPVSETEGSIPENLPEDEEDQFIDLSSEADATAALEAELSAEALKE